MFQPINRHGHLSAARTVATSTADDKLMLWFGQLSVADMASVANSGTKFNPLPIDDLLKRAISERFSLASIHMHVGDSCLAADQFRTAICRFYYAMYHAARAISFGHHRGDDYQQHSVLPDHLPPTIPNKATLRNDLMDARLMRNGADYDPYPAGEGPWAADAQRLAGTAAGFVQECEAFALAEGLV